MAAPDPNAWTGEQVRLWEDFWARFAAGESVYVDELPESLRDAAIARFDRVEPNCPACGEAHDPDDAVLACGFEVGVGPRNAWAPAFACRCGRRVVWLCAADGGLELVDAEPGGES